MPGRQEFEYELENDAEQMVKDLSFEETDDPEEVELKIAILDIYNSVLKKRQDRKKYIFNSGTLDFRKVQALDKKRSPDERDLYKKCRVFARLMTNDDFQILMDGLASKSCVRLNHR
jgi:transcriptional adapter 2-alpha